MSNHTPIIARRKKDASNPRALELSERNYKKHINERAAFLKEHCDLAPLYAVPLSDVVFEMTAKHLTDYDLREGIFDADASFIPGHSRDRYFMEQAYDTGYIDNSRHCTSGNTPARLRDVGTAGD